MHFARVTPDGSSGTVPWSLLAHLVTTSRSYSAVPHFRSRESFHLTHPFTLPTHPPPKQNSGYATRICTHACIVKKRLSTSVRSRKRANIVFIPYAQAHASASCPISCGLLSVYERCRYICMYRARSSHFEII